MNISKVRTIIPTNKKNKIIALVCLMVLIIGIVFITLGIILPIAGKIKLNETAFIDYSNRIIFFSIKPEQDIERLELNVALIDYKGATRYQKVYTFTNLKSNAEIEKYFTLESANITDKNIISAVDISIKKSSNQGNNVYLFFLPVGILVIAAAIITYCCIKSKELEESKNNTSTKDKSELYIPEDMRNNSDREPDPNKLYVPTEIQSDDPIPEPSEERIKCIVCGSDEEDTKLCSKCKDKLGAAGIHIKEENKCVLCGANSGKEKLCEACREKLKVANLSVSEEKLIRELPKDTYDKKDPDDRQPIIVNNTTVNEAPKASHGCRNCCLATAIIMLILGAILALIVYKTGQTIGEFLKAIFPFLK